MTASQPAETVVVGSGSWDETADLDDSVRAATAAWDEVVTAAK
jgi:hypothetical protein